MFTLYFPWKWCTGIISKGDKYTGKPTHPGCWVGWYLPTMQNSSTSMEVGSVLHMCHIWVEQVGPDYAKTCCLLCLTWPSWTALSHQAHCLQMALELRCLYAQPLSWVHLPWPALCWGWWVTNCSHVGASCTPPHPWGIPHRLVHCSRATFPPHIPYLPIGSVFYGGLQRQLHGLGPCPPTSKAAALPCLS